GKHTDNEPVHSIAKPLFQNIGFDPDHQGTEDQVSPTNRPNRLGLLLCRQRGIEPELLEVVLNAPLRVMIEVPDQRPNLSVNDEIFMHSDIVVPSDSPPKQTHLIIRIDTGPSHPSSVKKVSPGSSVGHRRAWSPLLETGPHLFTKFLGYSFICIEDQNPVRRRLRHPEILLEAEAWPGTHKDLCAAGAGQLHGLVMALRINHDQLVGPLSRPQTILNIGFFILGNQD